MSNNTENQEPMDNQEHLDEQLGQIFNTDTDAASGSQPLEEDVADEINPLEQEVKEINDKYLRLVAEFDNYRKRVAKEKVEIINNASEKLIVSLLEVLDDSDRALQQMENSEDTGLIKEGVQLVFQKFRKILESKGLTEMNTLNEEFNPDLHEALTEIPAPNPDLSGKVIDQVAKGYKLNDKIIRHAKVVVGK